MENNKNNSKKLLYTPEKQEEIIGYLKEGLPIKTVCKLVGIDVRTFYLWKAQGKDGVEPYLDFYINVSKEEGEVEREVIGYLMKLCKKLDLKAIEFLLKNRFSENWDSNARVEKEVNKLLEVILSNVSQVLNPQDYKKVLESLEQQEV